MHSAVKKYLVVLSAVYLAFDLGKIGIDILQNKPQFG